MPIRVAHISDIHFGRITQSGIVDALVAEINGANVDLVAVSGDLTQRSRKRELRAARGMLDKFQAPTLVVPGNHDAYAWWYPFHRLTVPIRRYRRFIEPDLSPSFGKSGLAVMGISTVHGWTVKSGMVRRRDVDRMSEYFSSAGDSFKILVVHHHFVNMPDFGRHDVSRFGKEAFKTVKELGVDLLLSGHLHRSHVQRFAGKGSESIVVASAGTATSNRGRNSAKLVNRYNMISISEQSFEIEERRFIVEDGRFQAERSTVFDR